MDDFSTLQSAITSSLVATTRTTAALATSDLPFHRSLDSSLSAALDQQNARLLSLAERLLGSATGSSNSTDSTSSAVRHQQAPRLRDIESVEGNWRAVVDVVDSLLERADTALDEFTGAVRRLSPGAAEKMTSVPARHNRLANGLRNGGREIEKPQLKFDHVPKNDETGPFVPLLDSKPHATVPLAEVKAGANPYQAEIETYRYPESVHTLAEPIPYHPFDSTAATFVDTEAAMYEMLEELKQADVIAVDLEHHDQRSYIGIVSLMQISTRDKDWIVDTLQPWRRKLNCLNEVLANPAIVKVLHGAYMDIVWLQRDLGLYLVGLFDTHYASRALGYSGGSLAFLLKKFADVDAQKQYQMADWRIRPLPKELFDYARSDTHYLLYIFDMMRNELIERSDFSQPNHEGDKLWEVQVKSSETALQRYEYPIYDAELGQGAIGWYKLLARTPALLSREQFAVFRAVHKWRDAVAREQDDSVHYVLPNHQIFTLAKAMPATREGVFNAVHPATTTVRLRADELLDVILRAKAEGANGPEMMETLNKVEPQYSRKAPKETAPSVPGFGSVAAFVPKKSVPVVNGAVPITSAAPVTSALPIRTTTSAFWGSALGQQDRRSLSTAAANVTLTVPLPPLTAEIFAEPPEYSSSPIKSPSPDPEPIKAPKVDEDVFVLKQLGKKRKREEPFVRAGRLGRLDAEEPLVRDGMAANVDEVGIDFEEEEDEHERASREKAERKKARKEAKRAARNAASAGSTTGVDGGLDYDDPPAADGEPFDYANAPSILNPPRESREEAREKRKKVVDPYRKSMDVPKALGRVQKERSGRSMTYKS